MKVIIVSQKREWMAANNLAALIQANGGEVLSLQGEFRDHADFFDQEIEEFLSKE